MRPTVASILLFIALPASAQDKAASPLEGTYTVKEFDRAGKPVPDEVKATVSAVSIVGGKLTLKVGTKELVAVLRADPMKKPAELDLSPQGADYDKSKKFLGLYQVENGELTILFVEDGERPKDFKTEAATATKLVLVKK